jgi:hypothetical protein
MAALLGAPLGAPSAQETTPPPPATDKKQDEKPAPQLAIPVPGPKLTVGTTPAKAGGPQGTGVATGEIVLGSPGTAPTVGQPTTGTVVLVGDPAKKVILAPPADAPPAAGAVISKDPIQLPSPPDRNDVKLALDTGGQAGSSSTSVGSSAKDAAPGAGQPSPGQPTGTGQATTGQAGQTPATGDASAGGGNAGSSTGDQGTVSMPSPGTTASVSDPARDCAGGDCPCPEEEGAGPGELRGRAEAGAGALLDSAAEPAAPLIWQRTIDDERATQQEQMSRLALAAEARKQARAAAEAQRLSSGEQPDEIQKALLRWYADHGLNLAGAPLSYYVEGIDPADGRRPVNVRVTFRTSADSRLFTARFRWTHRLGKLEWLERPDLSIDDLATLFDMRVEYVNDMAARAAQRKQDKTDAKARASRPSVATSADSGGSSSGWGGNGLCGNGAGSSEARLGLYGGGSCPEGPEETPAEEGPGTGDQAMREDEATPAEPTVEEQLSDIADEIARRATLMNKLLNVPGKTAADRIDRLKKEIGDLEARKQQLAAGKSPVVSRADEAWQRDAAARIAAQTARVAKLEQQVGARSEEADAAAETYGKALAEVASGKQDAATLSSLRTRMDAKRALASGTAKLFVTQKLLLEALAGTVALAVEAGATAPLAELLGDGTNPEHAIVALAGEAAKLQGAPALDVAAAEAELRGQMAAAAAEDEAYAEARDALLDGQERLAARAGEFAESGVAERLEQRTADLQEATAAGDSTRIDELQRRIVVDRSLVRAFEADLRTIQAGMPHTWELDPQARAAEADARLLRALELTIEAALVPQQRAVAKSVLSGEVAAEKDRVFASREKATRIALEEAYAANREDGIGPTSEVELRKIFDARGLALDPALVLSDAGRQQLVDDLARVADPTTPKTSFAADVAREFLAQAPNLLNPLYTTKASVGAIYGAGSHLVHGAIDLADLGGELLAADTDLSWHVRLATTPFGGWIFGTPLVADAFGTDKIDGIHQLVELVQHNDWSTIGAHVDRAAWDGIRNMQRGDAVWNNAKFGGAVAIEAIMLGLSGGSRGTATVQQVGLDLARVASATGRVLDRGATLGKLAGTPTLARALEGAAGASTKLGRGLEGVVHASRAKAAAKAGAAGPTDPVPGGTTLVDDTQVATHRPGAGAAAEPRIPVVDPPLGYVYTSQDRIRLAAFFDRTGEIRSEYILKLVRFWEAKGLEPAAVMAGRAMMRGLSPKVLEMTSEQIRALLHHYLRDVEGIADAARRDGLIERFLRGGDETLPTVARRPAPPTSDGGAAAAVERSIDDEPTVIVHENQRMPRAGTDPTYDEATVIVHENQRMSRAMGESIHDGPTVLLRESASMPSRRAGAAAPARQLEDTATSIGLGAGEVLALDPPRTIGEVIRRIRNVNPGFPDKPGSTGNCQECVEAVERILRGEDPAFVRLAPGDDSHAWFEMNSRAATAHIDPVLGRARDWIPVSGQKQIEDLMAATPPGSYARVWGERAAGEYGHVFNVWNDGQNVWFLDGQVGSFGTFAGQEYTRLSVLLTGF